MAFILLVQACLIIPTIILATSNTVIYPVALATTAIFSFAILVCMIAGLRVKITLPIFAISLLIHAAIIVIA